MSQMLPTRRLLPKIVTATASSSTATSQRCIQKRDYFTRHVPEPKMQIHLPKSQDVTVDSIVLADSHHDEKKPVVLMVGWAGANPKHIDKYIKIYNDEGYRVVSLCPPCYHYSIPNSRVGFYMSPLFRAIDAKPGDFRSFAEW
ncbi:hypothetical protein CAEBREN_18211 [Caenorhabditis brenneri]|uniref:Uncharacterized protein n=1 Tax=Caenorhabditis brenneri TaxID=135651 RepID=G0MNF0_CAEBE|nr:hypothetical protein CAEBREN_18211 [Caenorhabditis brenneri]